MCIFHWWILLKILNEKKNQAYSILLWLLKTVQLGDEMYDLMAIHSILFIPAHYNSTITLYTYDSKWENKERENLIYGCYMLCNTNNSKTQLNVNKIFLFSI